jgi:hypothetical protein
LVRIETTSSAIAIDEREELLSELYLFCCHRWRLTVGSCSCT